MVAFQERVPLLVSAAWRRKELSGALAAYEAQIHVLNLMEAAWFAQKSFERLFKEAELASSTAYATCAANAESMEMPASQPLKNLRHEAFAQRIAAGASATAAYETADFIYNPLHYLALLEQKTKALDQAAPLDDWRLADCVHRLRRLMEARMGTAGRREFVQVLRLMEDFHQHQVEGAVSEAQRLGAISFDAVKMLLLARLENRPARLDLTFYPYLPATTVGTTDPRAYLGLIAGSGFVSPAAGAQT